MDIKRLFKYFETVFYAFITFTVSMYLIYKVFFHFPIISIPLFTLVVSLVTAFALRKRDNVTIILSFMVVLYIIIIFFILKDTYLIFGEIPVLIISIISYLLGIYILKLFQIKKLRIVSIILSIVFCFTYLTTYYLIYNGYNKQSEIYINYLINTSNANQIEASKIDGFCYDYSIMYVSNPCNTEYNLTSFVYSLSYYPDKYRNSYDDFISELKESADKDGYSINLLIKSIVNIREFNQ